MLGPIIMATYPYSQVSLDSALQSLEQHVQQEFHSASPIPPALNHSNAFYAHEIDRIFKSEWICVGRTDEVPYSGDFLTYEIAQVPVLLVRQPEGDIKGFVNACAHRFACLVPESKGRAKKFTCRYHGWTYKTDGHLVAAPHMEMNDTFEMSKHGLREISVSTWQGFVYVSLAERPRVNLEQALSPLTENVVGRYDMGCYQTILREEMQWILDVMTPLIVNSNRIKFSKIQNMINRGQEEVGKAILGLANLLAVFLLNRN